MLDNIPVDSYIRITMMIYSTSMTKEQMATILARVLTIRGLSEASMTYMLTCLRVDELRAMMVEYHPLSKDQSSKQ